MSVRIVQGDVREVLPALAADSFDCIATSPPYYGLRDYGTAMWEGGDLACDHSQRSLVSPASTLRNDERKHTGPYEGEKSVFHKMPFRDVCGKCGARRIDAQIGLETTLDEYLETMVAVCRELRRVLKPSGVFFLNIGDSYCSTDKWGGGRNGNNGKHSIASDGSVPSWAVRAKKVAQHGLKPKDLMLVPERLGIALQADGWWVRSRIVWAKANPMPESCTDRPTSAHETIWMLTKSARYFWDAEAVKEGVSESPNAAWWRRNFDERRLAKELSLKKSGTYGGPPGKRDPNISSRNVRNVWTFASQPFPDAHFATFPPELAERCIKAGSSERGCCPACGKPWVRVLDDSNRKNSSPGGHALELLASGVDGMHKNRKLGCQYTKWLNENPKKLMGWQPCCKCPAADPVPSRILDCFAGAGTTGLVADRLGRDCTLIDLNTHYAEMALNRIRDDCPMFAEVAAE
jgi:DNA modification methylase